LAIEKANPRGARLQSKEGIMAELDKLIVRRVGKLKEELHVS
jgi:hypothetical protein